MSMSIADCLFLSLVFRTPMSLSTLNKQRKVFIDRSDGNRLVFLNLALLRLFIRCDSSDSKEASMLSVVKKSIVLLAALVPALLWGQASFEAQVRGVVRDSSGGLIVGARVTI